MDELLHIFGVSDNLKVWHVVCRTVIIVVAAFTFIRLSGRRSFGLHTPFDNLLAILMGAISSQGIIGRASVLNALAAGLTVALIHRATAIVEICFPRVGILLKGRKIPLFKDGLILKQNLIRGLVDEEDIMREFRLRTCDENLEHVDAIYMETSGQISAIRKPQAKR